MAIPWALTDGIMWRENQTMRIVLVSRNHKFGIPNHTVHLEQMYARYFNITFTSHTKFH